MRRREFIGLLGGVVAWPMAAPGQGARRKIGYLAAGSQSAFATRVVAFKEGLGSLGVVDGQDVAIDYRFVAGQYDRLQAAAADLRRAPTFRRVRVSRTPKRSARTPPRHRATITPQ
jgi:putative ABC transport system substrate-binding protein